MATLTNAQLVSQLYSDNPTFASLSTASQALFVEKGLPAIQQKFDFSQSQGQNEIFGLLLNRIAGVSISELSLRNPLSFLETSAFAFGAYMEQYGLHRVQEIKFRDPNDKRSQFDYFPTKISRAIFKINRESQYPISVETDKTRRAFLDEYGLDTLLKSQIKLLHDSNIADTYIYARKLFTLFLESGFILKSQVVPIPDLRNEKLPVEDIRTAVLRMKNAAKYMTFNRGTFNCLGRIQACSLEDLICIMRADAFNQNEVQNLSQAFNTEYLSYNLPVIEIDNFENDGVLAIVSDKRAFGYHSMAPITVTNSNEAMRKYSNYFLTIFQMFHASPFSNMVYFVSEDKYDDIIKKCVDTPVEESTVESILQ